MASTKRRSLLLSLLIFAGSAAYAFWRIEAKLAVMHENAHALGAESKAQYNKHVLEADKYIKQYIKFYKVRNYLLCAGLVSYLATKVGHLPEHRMDFGAVN